MLIRFAGDGSTTVAAARRAVEQTDWRSAALHAHSLAGAAGNLGATRLRELAKALELGAGAGAPDVHDRLAGVEREAARVFAAIQTLKPAAPADAAPVAQAGAAADTAVLAPLLARLRAALVDGDPVGSEEAIAALNEAGVPASWRADLARLRDLAERYEFEAAVDLADRLAQRLGGPA